MRITWLLEVADQLWGGVKVALEDANWLSRRGHRVTVVSRSGPPSWMRLDCAFQQVPDFGAQHLPDADVLVGTFWTTVPWAAAAGPEKGVPVHFCQGYEGDNPEFAGVRDRIEATYRLPGMRHVTIAPHLTALLQQRFGITATEVRYAIDHAVHRPAPARPPRTPLRVGLVGPWQVPWKDLPTGYAACSLAQRAGQDLVLVRASNTAPAPEERNQPFAIEWHERLSPAAMGDWYRSLDVLLATSSGAEEGFFLPAIEAMACGVPCVLTDIPCFRNHAALVGHDRYALFVPPRDPAAMAEALVLAGGMPDLRTAMRDGGFAVASHYTTDHHGTQLEAALTRFVVEAGGSSAEAARDATPPATTEWALSTWSRELRHTAQRRLHAGNDEEAARLYAAALCLDPGDDVLRLAAAEAQLAANRPDEALRHYDALLARGVAQSAVHTGRGRALHAIGLQATSASPRRDRDLMPLG